MKIRNNLLLVFLVLFFAGLSAQKKYQISGNVTDSDNGAILPSAKILIVERPDLVFTTDEKGHYRIILTPGNYTLKIFYIGYQEKEQKFELDRNIFLDIKLVPISKLLDEVTVSVINKNENILEIHSGIEKLKSEKMNKIPTFVGEVDIFKTLSLTPGIQSSGDLNGGIYVRGGNNSQNLILMDEATIYNPNHLLGFFSTFNSDAIREVIVYKGTSPAEFGGRLSSVFDVHLNDGNFEKTEVNGGLGLICSRLTVKTPLLKDKGAVMISGRRTYADLFLKLVPDPEINKNKLHFYDLNAKINFNFSDRDKFFASFYMGRDVFEYVNRFNLGWGNKTATANLNHVWGQEKKVESITNFIFSDFDYSAGANFDGAVFNILSKIKTLNFKHEFINKINDKNTLVIGYNGLKHTILPGQVVADSASVIIPVRIQERYGTENAFYLSHTYKQNKKLSLNYGLRVSWFRPSGPGSFYVFDQGNIVDTLIVNDSKIIKTFTMIEPRFELSYILNPFFSMKGSYNRNTQHLHTISNTNISLPTDIWLMSGVNIKPEISDMTSLGMFMNSKNDTFQMSAELYFKWMQNQPDLMNGADIRANDKIEGELLFGVGRAYGLEMMLKRKLGVINGWISYTLSRSEIKIPGINNGNWYPVKYDNTHNISVVAIWDINEKISLSGTWVYLTGNAVTLPSGKYLMDGMVKYYYKERNGYRMPPYHRLDLGATWYFKSAKNYESNLNFSVFNVYGRKNAFTLDIEQDPVHPEQIRVVKTYLFSVIPSVTYNFSF
jgi:hypothetical protein